MKIKTMKKITTILSIALFSLSLLSCSQKEDATIAGEMNPIAPEQSISMDGYNAAVKSQANLIRNLALLDNNTTRVSENPEYLELCNVLKDDADAFTADLQLTEEDMIEIFGESNNPENKNESAIGLLLFASAIDNCTIANTKGGGFVECLLEATGIAAGGAIVGSLVKGTMSKTLVKSVVKLVAGTAGKALSGINSGRNGLLYVVAYDEKILHK